MMERRSQRARLPEIWVVWGLFGLATVAVFETYWRLPPRELWKVTNSGFVGGAGRAFVFVSFSATSGYRFRKGPMKAVSPRCLSAVSKR